MNKWAGWFDTFAYNLFIHFFVVVVVGVLMIKVSRRHNAVPFFLRLQSWYSNRHTTYISILPFSHISYLRLWVTFITPDSNVTHKIIKKNRWFLFCFFVVFLFWADTEVGGAQFLLIFVVISYILCFCRWNLNFLKFLQEISFCCSTFQLYLLLATH